MNIYHLKKKAFELILYMIYIQHFKSGSSNHLIHFSKLNAYQLRNASYRLIFIFNRSNFVIIDILLKLYYASTTTYEIVSDFIRLEIA